MHQNGTWNLIGGELEVVSRGMWVMKEAEFFPLPEQVDTRRLNQSCYVSRR